MPPYTISLATDADVPALVHLIYLEKISLPVNKCMWNNWPNEIAQKARVESAVRDSLDGIEHKSYKIVDAEADRIVGLLVLTRKSPTDVNNQPKESKNEVTQGEVPSELRADVLEMVVARVASIGSTDEGSSNVDHIEITTLIIHPSVRGQGLGTILIRKACEEARAEDVPLILTAEPAAHNFFLKHGFKPGKHADMDLGKYMPPYSGYGIFRMTRMTWSA